VSFERLRRIVVDYVLKRLNTTDICKVFISSKVLVSVAQSAISVLELRG
jgi:hypothetical protein